MKNIKSIFSIGLAGLFLLFIGCNDFLDRAPLSNVTPDDYLKNESDLATYTVSAYQFPSHSGWGIGTYAYDNHTDNQATSNYSTRWVPQENRVPQSGGSWSFGTIRQVNFFLETVVPRWKAGGVSGNEANVAHYVGEGYFLRAYEYFNKVQAFGDFPIIRKTLPDQMDVLVAQSQRKPRNEVARFIISDLDSAIMLLKDQAPGGTNRISKNAALLFKSRVALHEATWLKYHQGTAHVPGGAGWPGEGKIGNFSINLQGEIDYFLTEAMEAAEQVADAVPLETNTQDDGYNSSQNPYFTMFSDDSKSGYDEVLFWRDYDPTKGVSHNVNHYMTRNGGNSGYTRGFVENFLMANGLPIYAAGSGYAGDDFIADVKKDRDSRLQLFMKAPEELLFTDNSGSLEGYPDILSIQETRYVTGYAVKKGKSYDPGNAEGTMDGTGSIVFRAVEAYLNYIEASYLKEGAVNAKAAQYWQAIRQRAGVSTDFNATIAATDMSIEAKNDFGAYSAGQLLADKTLYNIRRERRSELMAEGLRYFDLKRWRALDQLKTNRYIVEGFKLWGPMRDWYVDDSGKSKLIEPTDGGTANVSSSAESDYLRPYRINSSSGNSVYDGYTWANAHYLEPIATSHFIITTTGESSDLSTSSIYQNPGWSTDANSTPLE